MASSRDTSEQQIPLMNGNGGEGGGRDGETVIGGLDDSHSMNMGGRTVSAGASRGAGGSMIFQEKEQHPAFAIASYCVASILMTVTNKFVLSGHHFTMNFLLLGMQGLVGVLAVSAAKRAGLVTFRDYDHETAKKWLPVTLSLVCVIYTGSKALQYLTMAVYTIFKNLTIILIAYGELVWFGKSITPMTLVAFGLMVLSSVVAAYDDIARYLFADASSAAFAAVTKGNSPIGYLWMATNCIATASYTLGMKRKIDTIGLKDLDSCFYNNLLSVPVLAVFSLLTESWSAETFELNFPSQGRFTLFSAIFFSGLVAVLISYSTPWCMRVTSSTTYSMVGALNKLPLAASGIIFFGDAATFSSVTAIFLGGVAGVVYALAKQAAAAAAASSKGPGGFDMARPR